ncbi:hypothetical protein QE152_g39348 [Popillia japonica]|uniref:Uncharacterized protein n=1 Tax=Popillia japonica TaxID=7064 RepID=A0AAW1HUT2_POPJA
MPQSITGITMRFQTYHNSNNQKNKTELPLEFTEPKHPVCSSIFGYTKNPAIVPYVPKKKKNVLLITSLHHDDTVDEITRKSAIIMDYNNTKSGVDVVDR